MILLMENFIKRFETTDFIKNLITVRLFCKHKFGPEI